MNDPIAEALVDLDQENPGHSHPEQVLSNIDINLLVPLEALLATRNVSCAAQRIGQTQPALSRALARLRDLLGDELLVRSGSGFTLTARGEHLAELVPKTLSSLRAVLSERRSEATTGITICASLMPAVMPSLLRMSRRKNQSLKVYTHKSPAEGLAHLRSNTASLMIGINTESDDDIARKTIVSEDFVTLVAVNRCRAAGIQPNWDDFLELTHINVISEGLELYPQFKEALIRHGNPETRLCDSADMTVAALMVSQGPFALTVPRSVAGWLSKSVSLVSVPPPIPVPPQEILLYRHATVPIRTRDTLMEEISSMAREAIAKSGSSIHGLRFRSNEKRSVRLPESGQCN